MVKSKTIYPSQIGVHFPILLKLNVQSIIFSKFLQEIEAAAIGFVMERIGTERVHQNSRIYTCEGTDKTGLSNMKLV